MAAQMLSCLLTAGLLSDTVSLYRQPAWKLHASPAEQGDVAVPPLWTDTIPGGSERPGAAVCSGQSGGLLQPLPWCRYSAPCQLAG
jgi:hypothetical protein